MIDVHGERVDPEHALSRRGPIVRLWTSIAGGPLAWLIFLQLDYALVHPACAWGARWPLTLVGVLAAAAALGCATLGRIASRNEPERFLGTLGIALSLFFALVIAVSIVPTIVLDPCE